MVDDAVNGDVDTYDNDAVDVQDTQWHEPVPCKF